MNILSCFFKEKPAVSEVKTKQPLFQTVSCVVQNILDDLKVEYYDKWQIDYITGILSNFYLLRKRERLYSLMVYDTICQDYDYFVYIQQVSREGFTDYEKRLLSNAVKKLLDKRRDEKKSKRDRESQEKLKELFPNCYIENAPTSQ